MIPRKRLFKRALEAMIKILPALFWILFMFAFDAPFVAILTLICAAAHELGHIAALYKLTGGYKLKAVFSGLRLGAEAHISYTDEIIIAAFGPLVNLLLFLLLLPFYSRSDYIMIFGALNLFTALSNLIPIEGYDGYRIIECIIMKNSLGVSHSRILQTVSLGVTIILTFFSLYLIRSFDGGYWIFLLFIAVLIKKVKSDEKVFFTRKNEISRDL